VAEVALVDKTEAPDWGKVDAYLPQGSYACTSIIEELSSFYYKSTFRIAKSALSKSTQWQTCSQIEPMKHIVVLIDEARKTTDAGLLSLIYDTFHFDIKAASILTIPHHGLLINPVPDLFEGYEQYQSADWDGRGAEPITAETLAYAHRLMPIMPTKLGHPDAAPAADGSIALEWVPEATTHKLDKLFLDIGPGEVWRAYWTLRTGEFGRLPQAGFTPETKTILKNLFDNLSA
jgi:hypothetical protein